MPGRSEQPRYSSLHRLCIGLALLLTLSLSLPAAAQTPTPPGGPGPNRKYDVTHINLADGYRIEPVVINLYQMLASPLVLICGVLLRILLALGVLWRLAQRPAGVR